MPPKKILVIDDEFQITRVLKRSLQANRYDVRTAADGESGLEMFHDLKPDLVITDLSMPEVSGIDVCRELRRHSDVPIIVLSVKGQESTKVEALDAGADDYITKPFGMNELLARVRAALRRTPDENHAGTIEAGDLRIDVSARRVFAGKSEVHLTPKEFDLLTLFAQNQDRVMTHRTLLSKIWGAEYIGQVEYLRVFVGNLRKKIEPDPSKPKHILTEPWVGYRFVA